MNWATSFRSIAALGVVSFLLLTGYLSVLAQDPTLDVVALNKADAVSYRILFRQVENYKRLSDEAAAQGRDMSYLRQILPGRLELNKADAESLERISIACTGELTILQARVVQAIAASRQQASQNKALGTKSAVALFRSQVCRLKVTLSFFVIATRCVIQWTKRRFKRLRLKFAGCSERLRMGRTSFPFQSRYRRRTEVRIGNYHL